MGPVFFGPCLHSCMKDLGTGQSRPTGYKVMRCCCRMLRTRPSPGSHLTILPTFKGYLTTARRRVTVVRYPPAKLITPLDNPDPIQGWVERLVRRSSQSESGSDSHHASPDVYDGFREELNPSYRSCRVDQTSNPIRCDVARSAATNNSNKAMLMQSDIILVTGPLVGASSWAPTADRLRAAGARVHINAAARSLSAKPTIRPPCSGAPRRVAD